MLNAMGRIWILTKYDDNDIKYEHSPTGKGKKEIKREKPVVFFGW